MEEQGKLLKAGETGFDCQLGENRLRKYISQNLSA